MPTARIVSSPQANITVGDDVTIRCSCEDGMPEPKFRWTKHRLRARDTSDLPNSATVDENSGLLTIRNVQLRDSGIYSCVADNRVPPPRSVEIAVNVTEDVTLPPPTVASGGGNDYWYDNPIITPIVVTVTVFCVLVICGTLAYYWRWRRRRSDNGCKSDKVSSSSNALIHRERLEYLCADMNVILVSNATELDKMADPVLLEFWDCLVRMDVDPVIVFLREKRSLSVDETAGVRAAPCVAERLLEFLSVLKGDQASSVLSDALRHSDQTHLADLLDGKVLPDAKCVTIATTTETSFGITFRPAYKNPQHFGDVDKYLVTLELTTPEPKIIVKRRISASDPLQAEFRGLEQGTSYNVTVISKRGDVKSAGVTVTITTIGGYEEPSRLLQRFNVEEQSKIHHVLIYKDKITLLEPLGNGNFGEVRHGVYRKGKEWVECAAKTLYDTAAPNEMVSLLQEGLRMIKFNHDNVLELTGICVHGNQAMIVLPYMKHGDLRKYLIKKQTLPLLVNLRLCLDIARGMAYLSDNDIVHRDLAARNCMLDENLRVKVADFGLCRDVHEKGYYRIQSWEVKLPYKWMAPESHATYIFDTKTDIWSYGIVLWEIFAAGQTPYPGMPGVSIVHQLREGYRMERPNRCPIMLYNSVMKQCWLTNPLERPNFKEVLRKVEQIHTSFKHRSDFENTDVQVHSLA
ncbi:MST1R [Branchiostoma lanceolatum]|nr:MST1R [Branchiostoma lanceolatum]